MIFLNQINIYSIYLSYKYPDQFKSNKNKMTRNCAKFIIFMIVLILIQDVDLKLKNLKKIKTPEENTTVERPWMLIRNDHSNLCLSLSSNEILKQVECDIEQENQHWKQSKIADKEENFVKIYNKNGKYLTNLGGDSSRTSGYGVLPENNSPNQNFSIIIRDKKMYLKSEAGRCLSPESTNVGSKIEQRVCCKNAHAAWKFIEINEPEPEPQPAPEPVPEPQPAPEPVPAPQPAPQPKPAPKPTPQPIPAPQPAPQPKPAPKPQKPKVFQPSSTIPSEIQTFIKARASGLCLTVSNSREAIYTFAQCNIDNINQKFKLLPNGGDNYYIRTYDGTYAMNVFGGNRSGGDYNNFKNVFMNRTVDQLFQVTKVFGNYFKMVQKKHNKCLTHRSSGSECYIYECYNNDENQMYTFMPDTWSD
jgi:cell division septation protein DedD